MMALTCVLVVEGDAMIGMLLAEMLEDMGYEVCALAANEEDAVTFAARYRPGLMIVDVHLREGCGVTAVERILRAGPVPCVFISSTPSYLIGHSADTLQMPFLEGDLVRAIRSVIHGPAGGPALNKPNEK
jgi:chemotaxis response regulator CheB